MDSLVFYIFSYRSLNTAILISISPRPPFPFLAGSAPVPLQARKPICPVIFLTRTPINPAFPPFPKERIKAYYKLSVYIRSKKQQRE